MVDATGAPVLVGAPLLIAGFGANDTSRTYRYFFKDKLKTNTDRPVRSRRRSR